MLLCITPLLPEYFLVPSLPRLPPCCIHKSQKITELEQHISSFYWIRDEETRLDWVLAPFAILLVLIQSDPRIWT